MSNFSVLECRFSNTGDKIPFKNEAPVRRCTWLPARFPGSTGRRLYGKGGIILLLADKPLMIPFEVGFEETTAEVDAGIQGLVHGVRSTVTLDLAGREKGELSQRDYTNLSSTELQLR